MVGKLDRCSTCFGLELKEEVFVDLIAPGTGPPTTLSEHTFTSPGAPSVTPPLTGRVVPSPVGDRTRVRKMGGVRMVVRHP